MPPTPQAVHGALPPPVRHVQVVEYFPPTQMWTPGQPLASVQGSVGGVQEPGVSGVAPPSAGPFPPFPPAKATRPAAQNTAAISPTITATRLLEFGVPIAVPPNGLPPREISRVQ